MSSYQAWSNPAFETDNAAIDGDNHERKTKGAPHKMGDGERSGARLHRKARSAV